jgi:hypothetical protein
LEDGSTDSQIPFYREKNAIDPCPRKAALH